MSALEELRGRAAARIADRPIERRRDRPCYEVGFNNVANFNRRFLEVKGLTPSEFRRQAGQRFGGAPS